MLTNNKKVLLVDDEALNLKLFDKMLKEYDFQISTAGNGKECIDIARQMRPDLIILDWNMPVMDGIEALENLKKDNDTRDIPVLMITGVMTSSEDMAYAMALGAIDFLKKPFDKLELSARVKNILLLHQSLDDLKEQNTLLEDKNLFIASLLESIPHPVAYYSLDGILLMCNHFFEKAMAAEKDELIGKSVYRNFRAEEVITHVQKDMELIQTGSALVYEAPILSAVSIGEGTPYLISKNMVVDKLNHPQGIVAAFADVSEIKRANDEILKNQKAELISGTIKLMNVNELNSNLIEDIQKVIPLTSKEGKDLIKQIERKYKMATNDQIWNDFESRFELAFDSFLRVLVEKFPALTANERKLCALIRSGLSTKDIALLTFQNPQSVDVARYRLRKKLNMANEESLPDFLIKIGG